MIHRLLAILFLAVLSSCTNNGSTLNNSVRRNMSQFQAIKNQVSSYGDMVASSGIGSAIEGLEGKQAAQDSGYPFATIEQKNVLTNYSYLYDLINGQGDSINAITFIGTLFKRCFTRKIKSSNGFNQTKKYLDGIPIGWAKLGENTPLNCCQRWHFFLT